MDTAAIALTLRLAVTTTLLLVLMATPVAWYIARRGTLLSRVLQATVALPLVLPPTVLGFYLLVGLGPQTAAGRAILHLLGHPLAFTFAGLLVGSLLFSLPFAVQPLVAGFRAVPQQLTDTAAVLGATPWQVFRRIVLPLSKPALLTAAVLTFTHTVGEFGVVLMLGGDIPGLTRTLSIAIYDQVQEGSYASANRASLALVAMSFLSLLLVYARQRSTDEVQLV